MRLKRKGKANTADQEYKVHENGWSSVTVPAVTPAGILKDLGYVDLVDIDIQGEELNVIVPAIDELDAKCSGCISEPIDLRSKQSCGSSCPATDGAVTPIIPWALAKKHSGERSSFKMACRVG